MNKNIIIYIDAANIILSSRDANFDLDLDLLFQYLYDKYRDCKIIFFIGDIKYLDAIQEIILKHNVESVVLLSGDGDFVALTDYAKEMQKEVRCVSFAPVNTSIFIKQREYLKVMYLIQIKDLLENKKSLIKHAT
jgi:uncharacterized LabA/DUF88 family protein